MADTVPGVALPNLLNARVLSGTVTDGLPLTAIYKFFPLPNGISPLLFLFCN
ncbi:hypothetical protein I3679_002330 [Proteus mirabilis]|uniref:Uncharacterized protein n=1 Tax=Proteus mirabilis TaxID=584 RepID=A0ABD5LUA3_PROMI